MSASTSSGPGSTSIIWVGGVPGIVSTSQRNPSSTRSIATSKSSFSV
nr:hypothetical protein [Leucobacter sp. wl10]